MCKSIRNSCFFLSFLHKLLVFSFAFVSFSPIIVSAAQVTLEWDENSEEDLAGYSVFCRQEGQVYDYYNPVWEGTENTCTISRDVKSYFVVRAYNTSGMKSGNSNEVCFQPEDNDQSTDNPPQIINDNGDAGTSYTGTWNVSSGANPYGDRSFYSNEVNATYTFEAELVGSYEVSLWWTYWSNRCTSVPVEIYDGETLLDTVEVNQKANAGEWNPLGTYVFSGTASVVIISEGGCTTSADAVRFLSALPNDSPETCTDADFDGYYAESGCGTAVDCNDNDSSINPRAKEICDDNKDNDCNGAVDCADFDCADDEVCYQPKDNEIVTVEVQVSASSDDAEERASGSMYLKSTDLELICDYDAYRDQTVGIRFKRVDIPQGATIINAYVQFKVDDEISSEATSLSIEGEDIDDAPTLDNSDWNISSRSRTQADMPWFPVPWTKVGESSPDQPTSDISLII